MPPDIGPRDAGAQPAWASRCGGRRRRRDSPTTSGRLARRSRATARHRQCSSHGVSPAAARSEARCSRTTLGPLASAKRARRSRAPKAGRRRWRCCSWRPNSSADEVRMMPSEQLSPHRHPPRTAARLRRAVRLGLCARSSRARRAAIRASSSIVLRGALDGLAAVAPVGDPDWAAAARRQGADARRRRRRRCRSTPSSRSTRRCRTCTGSIKAGAATIVHAAATPYRERSHFDGQDVLESGIGKPGAADTGWLNRALAALAARRPAREAAARTRSRSGRSRRWWCAGRRRCCRGRRRGCRRRATTR